MESGANPIAGLLGFWMLFKLVSLLGVIGGGLYGLYCLSRVAIASERTADALEAIAAQSSAASRGPVLPGIAMGSTTGPSIYAPIEPPLEARPFTPPMPPPAPTPPAPPMPPSMPSAAFPATPSASPPTVSPLTAAPIEPVAPSQPMTPPVVPPQGADNV